MKNFFIGILFLVVPSILSHGKNISYSGTVTDSRSGKGIPFAIIRELSGLRGTVSNQDGFYMFRCDSSATVFVHATGYRSDTLHFNGAGLRGLSIRLEPSGITKRLGCDGIDPAEIVRKVEASLKKKAQKGQDYDFSCFSKSVIRTADSGKVKIKFIREALSRGLYNDAWDCREEILGRRSTENFPEDLDMFSFGPLNQNFYSRKLVLMGRGIPSPLGENAPYRYALADHSLSGRNGIFKIYFSPMDDSSPGFSGFMSVEDGSFDLTDIEAWPNEAALSGTPFLNAEITERFSVVAGNLLMPADLRLRAEGSRIGIPLFELSLHSVFCSYELGKNPRLESSLGVLRILPEADLRDSSYWANAPLIPETPEESEAWILRKTQEKDLLSPESLRRGRYIGLGKNISVGGPLNLYRFNRVEGHKLALNLKGSPCSQLDLEGTASYAFAQRKVGGSADIKYSFMPAGKFLFSIYDKTEILFGTEDSYIRSLYATATSLLGKYDPLNYFNKKGFDLVLSAPVSGQLNLKLGFENASFVNLATNTDFSVLNQNKKYPENRPVYRAHAGIFSANLTLDWRNYIIYGLERRPVSDKLDYLIFNAGLGLSDKKIYGDLNFRCYDLGASGRKYLYRSTFLSFDFRGLYSFGKLPIQLMGSPAGNYQFIGNSFSFRTLGIGECFGDRLVTCALEYNFRDELFKELPIGEFRRLGLTAGLFMNIGLSEISSGSLSILEGNRREFRHPLYEAGFFIGQLAVPLRLEAAWRLNYMEADNFVIAINLAIL